MLRDTRLIFLRQMRLGLRNPAWLIIGVIQPILYLALFGPLVKHYVGAPGASADVAWRIFVPGLLVQLGLFGSLFVGFAIISEWRAGVIERMRVTPVSRFALLLGRVMRDAIALLVQSTILVLTGLVMGLRAPIGGILLGLAFVLVLSVSMSSLSYTAGLALKNEDALAPLLNSVAVPVLLLSGILLPLNRQSAPTWLYDLSRINPFRYIVDAMREVFLGSYANGTVLWGVLVSLGLAAVCMMMGVRRFQIESA
jgi:ABC-2 type transport system permease protein